MSELLAITGVRLGRVRARRGSAVFSITSALAGVPIAQAAQLGVWGVRTKTDFDCETRRLHETAVGGLGLLRYPLSLFSRVEGPWWGALDRFDFTLNLDEPGGSAGSRALLATCTTTRV